MTKNLFDDYFGFDDIFGFHDNNGFVITVTKLCHINLCHSL